MAGAIKHKQPLSLLDLCDELLLHVFTFLDVPELLNTSRTCHPLRTISLDPLLHRSRLHEASQRLSLSLSLRPSFSSLRPPISTIYLSRTHLAARFISRRLISHRLNRSLSRRPSASDLVDYNILPAECCAHNRATGEVMWGCGGVAPGLVDARRKFERERVKDRLRGWLLGQQGGKQRGLCVAEERGWVRSREAEDAERRPDVRSLAQRFARRAKTGGIEKAGAGGNGGERHPTRAYVSRLKRFWERVGREGGSTAVAAA
ncbi:MAG: hypothetical protein M1837_002405 [Sclerophora amabilis]|nr:MAG: hypothetical protein M1837_002405 [Sclerophora amabilis]